MKKESTRKLSPKEIKILGVTMRRFFRSFVPKKKFNLKQEMGHDLAWTIVFDNEAIISINFEHEIAKDLSLPKKKFFYFGVFCHEMLHQMFSDFSLLDSYGAETEREKKVFGNLLNVIEDTAIEYMAGSKIGGMLLKALRFSILHIYRMMEPLETYDSPFTQYMMALIMFGDKGCVKGHFTFPEAADCFYQSIKAFNQGVEDVKPRGRYNAARELLKISRPLWETETDETSEIEDLLRSLGKKESSSLSSPSFDGEKGDESEISKKRKEVEKEVEAASSEGTAETSEETSCGAAPGEKNTSAGGTNMSIKGKSTEDATEENPTEDKVSALTDMLSDKEDEKEDISLTRDEMEWLKKEDKTSSEEITAEKEKMSRGEIDTSIESTLYKKGDYTTKDYDIVSSEETLQEYRSFISPYQQSITSFTRKLKKLFSTDISKTIHSKSGKVNVKRFHAPTKTTRVFDKKKAPKDVDDIAITILVDESGSMSRENRIEIARTLTSCLAETMAALKIPVYCLGFSGENCADVEFYHYIKWKNTPIERSSLLQISHRFENFDAYAINYASEILKRRRAKHKILIVLSDGCPACTVISRKQGIIDTRAAIERTRKQGIDVLGIAIGNSDTEFIQSLYGKNFLHTNNVNNTFVKAGKEIEKIIKQW